MNEHGGEAPREEILQRAEEQGIDKMKARSLIDRLQRDGEITEPRQDIIKLV